MEKLFVHNFNVKHFKVVHLRLIRIYYIYLQKSIRGKYPLLEKRILENWEQIENKMLEIPHGMKALLAVQKKEVFTREDWYLVYRNKMDLVYSYLNEK